LSIVRCTIPSFYYTYLKKCRICRDKERGAERGDRERVIERDIGRGERKERERRMYKEERVV
jgi:hypothetical protein